MSCTTGRVNQVQIAAHPARATLFVSLELSKSKWLATVLLPGGDKMSKHTVLGGDWDALLALLLRARAQAEARVGKSVQIVAKRGGSRSMVAVLEWGRPSLTAHPLCCFWPGNGQTQA